MGGRHSRYFGAHTGVVQYHGDDGQVAAHRRLEVQPGHAKGGVAHKVDAHLIRLGQLGPDYQPQAGAQAVGLAPTDVAAGAVGAVEGEQFIPRTARIVGNDGVFRWDGLHKVPDDPVGVNWPLVVGQLVGPLAQPGFPLGLNGRGSGGSGLAAVPHNVPAGVNQLAQGQLGVGHYGDVHLVVLVQVPRVVGNLDDGLARRDVDVTDVLGKAAPDAQHQVGPAHKLVHRPGHYPAGAAQGQGMGFREDALAGQAAHHRHL